MEKYIFDIVLGVVAVVIIVFTAKRGFVLSLLNTVAVALSGFLSYKFSKPVSEFIYSSFLYDKMVMYVRLSIEIKSSTKGIRSNAKNQICFLPAGSRSAAPYSVCLQGQQGRRTDHYLPRGR